MSQSEVPAPEPVSREELLAMVSRAHLDPTISYADGKLAGRTLAAASRLPKVIAENLGAAFGQWTFFPEPSDVVAFACGYVPPATEDELMALARAWADDDAASRPTVLALVGREILLFESRRLESPRLRALFEETRPTRALALRQELGLPVPPPREAAPARAPKRGAAPRAPAAASPKPAAAPAPRKPSPRAPAAPAPPPKRFVHPKFGEGVLQSQDGTGPDAKLTLTFSTGPKTVLARFVVEAPGDG